MTQILMERIQIRLDVLGLSQFEAALNAGKNRNYIYDILVGTKKKLRPSGVNDLAVALKCSKEYLLGVSDEIGVPPAASGALSDTPAEVPVVGFVEAGTHRRASDRPSVCPQLAGDLRFPVTVQSAYMVRGEDFPQVHDGMFVIAVDPAAAVAENGAVRLGDTAIIERRRMVDDEVKVERILKRLDSSAGDRRMIDALGRREPATLVGDFIIGIMIAAYLML